MACPAQALDRGHAGGQRGDAARVCGDGGRRSRGHAVPRGGHLLWDTLALSLKCLRADLTMRPGDCSSGWLWQLRSCITLQPPDIAYI